MSATSSLVHPASSGPALAVFEADLRECVERLPAAVRREADRRYSLAYCRAARLYGFALVLRICVLLAVPSKAMPASEQQSVGCTRW